MVSSNAVDVAAGSSAPQRARWVVFVCAGQRFGFPLERVSEIVAARPFTRLPGTGREVCGLIGVRGRAVTVLDIGVVLGVRSPGTLPDHRLLLLDLETRRIGVAVDDVVAIQPAQLQAGADSTINGRDGVLGAGTVEGETFTALDPVRLTADLLEPM